MNTPAEETRQELNKDQRPLIEKVYFRKYDMHEDKLAGRIPVGIFFLNFVLFGSYCSITSTLKPSIKGLTSFILTRSC